MKTSNLLTIALAILTIISSCKKDTPERPPDAEPKKCLLANEFDGKFYYAYYYNSGHNKIIQTKFKSDNYPDTSVTDYVYTGNVIQLKNLTGSVFNRYYLNSSGNMDSSVSNNQGFYMKYSYFYNPDGFLNQTINKGNFGTFDFFSDTRYFYLNENLIRTVTYQESGDSVEFTYDYFQDHLNYFGKSVEIHQMTGKQSKNLLKSIITSNGLTYKYTYQYNADQLPLKKFQINHDNDSTTTLYNWTCY